MPRAGWLEYLTVLRASANAVSTAERPVLHRGPRLRAIAAASPFDTLPRQWPVWPGNVHELAHVLEATAICNPAEANLRERCRGGDQVAARARACCRCQVIAWPSYPALRSHAIAMASRRREFRAGWRFCVLPGEASHGRGVAMARARIYCIRCRFCQFSDGGRRAVRSSLRRSGGRR